MISSVGIEDEMKPMTKSTPFILLSLLVGGGVLFGLNAFFPVPIETWFAIAGMLVFAAGMLFGIAAGVRSIAVLSNAAFRKTTGILLPVLTIVIAGGAWAVVITTAIQVKHSMDEREKSQPSPGAYSSKAANGLTGNAQE